MLLNIDKSYVFLKIKRKKQFTLPGMARRETIADYKILGGGTIIASRIVG